MQIHFTVLNSLEPLSVLSFFPFLEKISYAIDFSPFRVKTLPARTLHVRTIVSSKFFRFPSLSCGFSFSFFSFFSLFFFFLPFVSQNLRITIHAQSVTNILCSQGERTSSLSPLASPNVESIKNLNSSTKKKKNFFSAIRKMFIPVRKKKKKNDQNYRDR